MPDYFYPRPPRGGRLESHRCEQAPDLFLSTPSARRATRPFSASPRRRTFLSTPSARRATPTCKKPEAARKISIHALREEGDLGAALLRLCHKIFLSTPSARRATHCSVQEQARGRISIHALREEGDPTSPSRASMPDYFYPRPPRGGRLESHRCEQAPDLFLSTPSARRATRPFSASPRRRTFLSTPSARRATPTCKKPEAARKISIHALREEGDLGAALLRLCHKIFLSTPSARRATHCSVQEQARGRISIHALREEGDRRFCRL